METIWHRSSGDSTRLNVGIEAKEIFLLGMTETQRPRAWSDARTYAARYFVGDNLGRILLHYADGSTQNFPLILGESVWWGLSFYQARQPFPTDTGLREAFAHSIRLFPARPTDDGNYVAVISPRGGLIESIEIMDSPDKDGSVEIAGVTVESVPGISIRGGTEIPSGELTHELKEFVREKPLRPAGIDENESRQRLSELKRAFYTSDTDFRRTFASEIPSSYRGPEVIFKGTAYASALQNAFYANVEDMLAKIDRDGRYHTSTRGALSWAGLPWSAGGEFGTYRPDVGIYYSQSWSRDLGRSLQELAHLGYLNKAELTADYALREENLWTDKSSLKYDGQSLPAHWSRIINRPDFSLPFENDGHGLIALFLYQLWRRLPDRDAWLRAHWAGIKAAGDWIPWQFDHPTISGAKDGVLHTTGEAAGGNGFSVYGDSVCMTALEALAQMADSIGESQSAELWRNTAEKMRNAIPRNYLITDPQYGRIWTLVDAGWPNKSTVLGPLIFTADYRGYAPGDIDQSWKAADSAAYQRLIETYKPFGFYGWAMGYGQGFVTQSALLLDRMKDATTMLNWTAREVYDPQINSFVVPEGAQVDPSGRYIYRTGDQGNGVQEAEIVKVFRILTGVDDSRPAQLQILPRVPYGWTEMAIRKYPALVAFGTKTETVLLSYDIRREAGRMTFTISATRPLDRVAVRFGPFAKQPAAGDVRINGRAPADASVEYSGDSWWVKCIANVRSAPGSTSSAVPGLPMKGVKQ